LLIGFAGGLRRSELAAMRCEDLDWNRSGLTVQLPKSETDQEGQGREVEFLFGAQPEGTALSKLTCPVRSLVQWHKQANITGDLSSCASPTPKLTSGASSPAPPPTSSKSV